MKKRIFAALVFFHLAVFTQIAFAFSLKLVSISGDRAEVLVNGMPRSFPVGFVSQEGIKLVSASSGKASFQAASNAFTLAPGQSFDDAVCRDQQKQVYFGSRPPCGVAATSDEANSNRARMNADSNRQAEWKRQDEERAAAAQAAKVQRDFEADSRRRPEQRIYNVPLQKK